MNHPLDPVQVRVAFAMLGIFLLIVICDAWLWWHCGQDATFSSVARQINRNWPGFGILVSVAVGSLLGHWFWP